MPKLILFDGECAGCNRWVRFILERDTRRLFQFCPLNSPMAVGLIDSRGIHARPDSIVLIEDDKCYFRSEAIIRILEQLPGPWRGIGALRWIPQRLRDALYDVIARNRSRWLGVGASCSPWHGRSSFRRGKFG